MSAVSWTRAMVAVALLGCARADDAAMAQEVPEPTSSASAPAPAVSGAPVVVAPGGPLVDLAGIAHVPETKGELGATSWLVRVHAEPKRSSKVIGYLRAGTRVAAREERRPPSDRCKKGWRTIAPSGWVCMTEMTDDMQHEVVRAIRPPDVTRRLPYMYGTVTRGGPVYARIPTAKHLETYEPSLEEHLGKWRKDRESGATYGLDVWLRHTEGKSVPSAIDALEQRITDTEIPFFLRDGRTAPVIAKEMAEAGGDAVKVDQVDRRQGRAFIHSFLHEGRRYNVTPDLLVIPADRCRPIRGSGFHGWQVDKELRFPFALVRRAGGKSYRLEGKKLVEAADLEWRSAHLLTGKQMFHRDLLHYETDKGLWIDDRHASRIDPAKRWPKWAKQGQKWIDVNITKQVLVAYEGKTMVYATLVSTGEAGLEDAEHTTATKRGIFRIHKKWLSTTMDSEMVGEEFELRDVPYVQYFEEGYAIHGAYWHDGFGQPKSHGCINLAPEDARRLFFWTDPPVPQGWHGAEQPLKGTVVFVHP